MYSTDNPPPKALTVLVNVEVKPDRLDDFMKAIQSNAVGSRNEEQCFRFDILRNEEDPNKFTFYEVYKDREAQAAHRASSHFKVWNDFVETEGLVSKEFISYEGVDMTQVNQ